MNNHSHVLLRDFFLKFLKMSTCQSISVSRVIVNILYLIWSLYSLFLFNLVSILFKIEQFYPSRNGYQI